MSEDDRPRVIPTAADKRAADFEDLMRTIRTSGEFAAEIAAHRRRLFIAYKEAGFTETQALDLCRQLL